MSKEIAVSNGSNLQVYTKSKSMGAADDIDSSDIQIPSLMLMQSSSTLVKDRSNEIKDGDFVNSITSEVLGHADGGDLELVVVDMFKTEILSEVAGNKWISTQPWQPHMQSLPYEDEVNGVKIRRQKAYNYVCFMPLETREVMTPDGKQYIASPFIVKFKGMGAKNGKKFNQMLKDMASFGSPSWATSFKLSAASETNDKGTFNVYSMSYGEQTIKEVQLAAVNLCEMSQAARDRGDIIVVDSEEQAEEKVVKNHADDLY
jgi:hypothetical protein